jgi:hypothetical protein
MKGLLVLDELTSQLNAKFNQSVLTTRDTAKAMNEKVVAVNVPWEYRNNPQRYILVARQIPLAEPKEKRQEYRQKLRDMLQDPAHTVRAAVRLEALGKESVSALKSALEHPHPLVRFAAAESLAYLGDGSGVSELAQLAEQHYQLRAHCLTALASLDLTASRTKLTELLASGNTETRYGAFRGLQLLNVAHPSVTGELLGGSVRLHRLAPHSPGMVHFTLHRRAEVTLFGQDAYLVPPFKIPAGQEFTVTAAAGDKLCTIGHYQVHEGRVSHRQCSLKLEDVLRNLTDMGGEYPEVVDLLRQAGDLKRIDCPVCLNAVPQPTPVEELAKAGLDPKQWNLVPARLENVNPTGMYDPQIRQASGVSDQ